MSRQSSCSAGKNQLFSTLANKEQKEKFNPTNRMGAQTQTQCSFGERERNKQIDKRIPSQSERSSSGVSSELRNNKVVISQEEKIFSNNQEKKVAKFFDKNYQQSLKVCEGDTLEDFATPKKKKKKKKKSLAGEAKSRRSMFDEELDKYTTYEEYLDSLVSEEDHKYLEDEEMARQIAELGYRSSGDTLTRDNFYKLKARLAESRLLSLQHQPSIDENEPEVDTEDDPKSKQDDDQNRYLNPKLPLGQTRKDGSSRLGISESLSKAIRSRIQAIRKGELLTILFIRTKIPRKSRGRFSTAETSGEIEISGHIDLAQRMKSENIMPYLNGEKRLLPRRGDLTYYNWCRGTAHCKSTSNFEVVAEMPKLRLRHKNSQAYLDITTTQRNAGMSMDSRSTRGSGWVDVSSDEEGSHAMIYDVQLLETDDEDDDESSRTESF